MKIVTLNYCRGGRINSIDPQKRITNPCRHFFKKVNFLQKCPFDLSGWQDSNLRPPRPKRGAITGLRYTPNFNLAERLGFEPRQHLRVDRLAICSITTLAPLQYFKNFCTNFAVANVTLHEQQRKLFI